MSSINTTLAGWVAGGAPVRIDRDGERLTDRRFWVASLPDGEASIPCGGTHVASLAELNGLTVSFTSDDAHGTTVLRMVTRARPQGRPHGNSRGEPAVAA